jgi:hypothetical protein
MTTLIALRRPAWTARPMPSAACARLLTAAWLLTVAAGAVMVPSAAVRAAEPPLPTADSVPDQPPMPAVLRDGPAVHARLPGCAVWTDRCVTCTHEAGRVSCSNIGIACQPQAVECVRSEQAEEKKEEDKSGKQEN